MINPSSEFPLSKAFEFEPFINYESIICTYFPPPTSKINVACMGVHFTPMHEVYLHVYVDTDTYRLLQPGVCFSINFSENFYEYAVAGLPSKMKSDLLDELPKDSFRSLSPVPILQSAWTALICQVIEMPDSAQLPTACRRREIPNIRATIQSVDVYHLPRLFNNRAFNLALEALIFATRIPYYTAYSPEYNDNLVLYRRIKKKIIEWRDMDRFQEAFQVIDNYLLTTGVKSQDLFDL